MSGNEFRRGIRFHHCRRRLGRVRAGQPAARRSGDPGAACIEAGGKDTNPWIHIPAGFYRNIYHPKITWQFETEPVPGLDGRRIPWPRGKVLGGSSSINGLIYIRGQRQDFDSVAAARQYRLVAMTTCCPISAAPRTRSAAPTSSTARAARSPSPTCAPATSCTTPLSPAAQEAGFQANPDFNGAEQEGVGNYQLTVRKMRRCSAAVAYLRPAMKRPNLKVEIRALAHRVLFDGKRAVGLEYAQNGVVRRVRRAARGIAVPAARSMSPQLLQLSGVGPAELLQRARHRGGARTARGRRQPAGPSRLPHHLQGAQAPTR